MLDLNDSGFIPLSSIAEKKHLQDQLSDLIKQTRKTAGLSQNELAEFAGVGKTLIFELEKGHENMLNIRIDFSAPQIHFQTPHKRRKK